MNNYKVVVAYQGTRFYGFQAQPRHRTVEAELMAALRQAYREEIKIVAAGRTDTGVHATGQVINYQSRKNIPVSRLPIVLNYWLADDIRIISVSRVAPTFNARRSAKSREYEYLFSDKEIPLYLRGNIARIKCHPDPTLFDEIATNLIGKHDFVNFRNTGSSENNTVRELLAVKLGKRKIKFGYKYEKPFEVYYLYLKGNSFLYKMVRNIMGYVNEIFKGKQTIADLCAQLNGAPKARYTTMNAKGLCLVRVNYK